METGEIPLPLTIGVVYNLKKGIASDAEDIEAEYDSLDTVNAIMSALAAAGHHPMPIEADADFVENLKRARIDLVFNIAEGGRGRAREGQVPAILEFLNVPYSGSDPTTLCMALDKALTKRYLSTAHIQTPRFQLVTSTSFDLDAALQFPLIVKPNSEGSSKGISDVAVAADEAELKGILSRNFRLYGVDMLIEEFIPGREFTVGLIGNGDALHAFEPMEIVYLKGKGAERVYSYQVKRNYQEYIGYQCPPDLDELTIARMKQTAIKVHSTLNCRDFSRADFRLADDGTLHFIEINPLPGLAPGYSDYPMLAEFCGVSYNDLVQGVLNAALARYGINTSHEPRTMP